MRKERQMTMREDYETRVKHLFKLALQEAKKTGIPVSENISSICINSRARKRLGCCKEITKGRVKSYQIEVSIGLKNAEDKRIKEVILHELLHTCKGCMNHGQKWKKYAEVLNEKYGYEIKRLADSEILGIKCEAAAAQTYPYVICCENCGAKGYRMKRSSVVLHPENYRCKKCGGTLRSYRQR